MSRLWIKLAVAFALLVAVTVGMVGFAINRSVGAEFAAYVQGGQVYRLEQAAATLARFYTAEGSWQGIAPVLADLQFSPGQRWLLADDRNVIVADTAGTDIGQDAATLSGAWQAPVVVNGKTVGALYLLLGSMGRGMGPGGGMGRGPLGPGPAASPGPVLQALETQFLDAVNRTVWTTAGIAIVLAVLLGVLLAKQITGPISMLRHAVHRIAGGDLSGRVNIRSKDEVGDLAASFNVMAEALEKNELARRHMVADIAHELKTPLTIIEGTTDALLDGVFQPNWKNLTTIKEESQALAKLVDDLRDLSLAEAGQLKLEREPSNVAQLVEQATRVAEAGAREKSRSLETHVESWLPTVSVDRARMAQVLQKLISNAIQHTRPRGKITVEARQEADSVLLIVRDSGEGIPSEDLPFIFDRFYRSDKSRARVTGGTGLGLAIVKQLVEAHGGRVWVESIPGEGSAFYVSLPLDKRETSATSPWQAESGRWG